MSPTSNFTVLHLWTLTRNHPPRKALCPIWLNDETRIDSIEKERGVDKTSEISRIGRERGPFSVISTKGGIPEKGRRGKREGPRPHATLTERKRSCRDVDVVRTRPTDWSSQRRVFQYARGRGPTLIAVVHCDAFRLRLLLPNRQNYVYAWLPRWLPRDYFTVNSRNNFLFLWQRRENHEYRGKMWIK